MWKVHVITFHKDEWRLYTPIYRRIRLYMEYMSVYVCANCVGMCLTLLFPCKGPKVALLMYFVLQCIQLAVIQDVCLKQ